MKQSVRIIRMRAKITLSVLVVALLIGVLIGGFSRQKMKKDLMNSSKEHTMAIAEIAARFVDGDINASLMPGEEGSDDYNQILATLQSFLLDDSSIEYIYTMRKEDGEVIFVVDADQEEGACIGDTYETYDVMEEAFAGHVVADDEVTTDQWGSVYTGFAPIYDSNGQIAGIVGVDCSVESINKELAAVTRTLILIEIICFLLAAGIAFLLGLMMTGNVQRINDKMDELANSDGDLTSSLDIRSGDEIENVASNFNIFIQKLHDMMLKIRSSEEQLSNATQTTDREITEANRELAAITDTLSGMTHAMQGTNDSVTEIRQAATDVKELAASLHSRSEEGAVSAKTANQRAGDIQLASFDSQQQIQLLTQSIASEMEDKIQKAEQIKEIIHLTNDIIEISDQTQLLALNASIEAARAGSEGRGFAVVASEISNLATATSKTAQEIEKINAFTVKTVESLAETAQKMIQIIQQEVIKAYDQLTEISSSYQKDTGEFHTQMNDYSQLSGQLSQDIIKIEDSLTQIMSMIEEETQSISDVTTASNSISDKMNTIQSGSEINDAIIEDMGQLIGQFTM